MPFHIWVEDLREFGSSRTRRNKSPQQLAGVDCYADDDESGAFFLSGVDVSRWPMPRIGAPSSLESNLWNVQEGRYERWFSTGWPPMRRVVLRLAISDAPVATVTCA